MTARLKAVFLRAGTKIHTIHPGLVLPVIGFGAWLTTTAVLALTEPKPVLDADRGGQSQRNQANSGPDERGNNTQTPYSIIAPAPVPAQLTGGGLLTSLFGGGLSSNTGGGGGDSSGGGSGGGSPARPKLPGQPQASLVPKSSTTGAERAREVPRGLAQSKPANTPPPHLAVPPMQRPPVYQAPPPPPPPPPVFVQPAPAQERLVVIFPWMRPLVGGGHPGGGQTPGHVPAPAHVGGGRH
jgi:hypothetical protein